MLSSALSTRSVLILLATAVAASGTGCKTTSTDTDTPVQTTTGAGGSDGSGGSDDGSGGSLAGTGGEDTTGSGGAPAGTCGTDTACWGDEASTCGTDACEAPEIYFQCPATGDYTDAHYTCSIAASIYREGIWANLVDCLIGGGADIETQCDDGAVNGGACVEAAYSNACANADADALCEGAATACAEGGDDSFTTEQCKADMVVMSGAGLAAYADCFDASADVACSDIHDLCYVEITSL